jgi:hypothetical protein
LFRVGFGFDCAADDFGGAELCSLAPLDGSALLSGKVASEDLTLFDDGLAELRSAAPPDVSALPWLGTCASFEASGETPGCVGRAELSAAIAGVKPSSRAAAVQVRRRFIIPPFSSSV